MGLFTRRDSPSVHPITGFWQWWTSEGAARFTAAADSGEWGSLSAEMGEQLAAVHPDLAWDTGAGRRARHLLAVSSDGDAVLRRIAEQWLRAAPAADDAWEYAAARQPVPGVSGQALMIDGYRLDAGDVRFRIAEDPGGQRLDLEVHHPVFPDLPEGVPLQVSFLILDWILGEDGVERWVGAVDTSANGATATADASDLAAAAKALADRERAGSWVLMEAVTPAGDRVLAKARRPLRWIDYPMFDLHTEVRLTYSDYQDDGLPTQASLDFLRRAEDGISAALGTRGILVAQETAAGTRVLHYYSDSEDQNSGAVIETAARAAGGDTRHVPDPGWKHMRKFS